MPCDSAQPPKVALVRFKTIEEVRLDGEKNDRMAFQARADYQNHAIGWLQRGYSSLGGGTVVRFPRIWMASGECRINTRAKDTGRRAIAARLHPLLRRSRTVPQTGPSVTIAPSDPSVLFKTALSDLPWRRQVSEGLPG